MIHLSYVELFILLVLWLFAGGEMGFLLAHHLQKRRLGCKSRVECKECGTREMRHQSDPPALC